jgi:TBC1 domain family member 6
MVTQFPPGTADADAVYRRRAPPPRLRLDSNSHSSSSSSNSYGTGYPHYNRPNLNSTQDSPTLPASPITYATANHISPRNEEPGPSHIPDDYDDMPVRSPTKTMTSPNERHAEEAWPLPMTDTVQDTVQNTNTVPRMRSGRPGLRISMSTSSLYGRRRSPLPDRQADMAFSSRRSPLPDRQADMAFGSRPLPRFPPRVTPDLLQYSDPLRSSQNSGQTSFSSFEQMSGTERSSILTKSSSITDMSPDTPNGYFGEEDDMTVEDAIGMYLDDIVDLPEESSAQSVTLVGELDVIAENMSSPAKHSSAASLTPRRESRVMEQDFPDDRSEEVELPVEEEEEAKNDGLHELPKHEPSRLAGSSQKTGPAELEGETTRKIGRQLAPKNLSIDVSLTKNLNNVAQPIPSPRYSTIVRVAGKVPPPFLPGTDDRDRYGFRKVTHQVSREQFEAWNRPYAAFAEHRRLKWVKLLESSGLPTDSPSTFPPKTNMLKRYIRKGIPSEYRGAAWFYYAGGFQHMHPHPGHYTFLVEQAMSSPINTDKEHIERDLYRTFPDNVHFKPDMADSMAGPGKNSVIVETQMIRSLRRVLYAFALHNPRVGYTQSLNFIAGMLLLFLPEEKAFWMLHIITSELLPATHEISLEGANVDMWILMVLLRDNLPHVYTKLVSNMPTAAKAKAPALTVNMRLPDITLGLTNWLMSIFIGSLPLETTLRVWDCLFYEGSKTFFRVALGIFKAGEREILSVSDPMEVFQIVQTIPKRLLDANALLEESLSRKYRMGQGRIDALREERREAVRQEKTRLSLFASKSLGLGPPSTRTGSRSPLPRLDGWRTAKKNTFN